MTPWTEIVLLNTLGSGTTDEEKLVQRQSVAAFMACRMEYLDPAPTKQPEDGSFFWTPFDKCTWHHKNRAEKIEEDMKIYWNFKPLEINEETRWKKVEDKEGEELRRATAIMNKLSWTTLEKLTASYLEVLGVKGNSSEIDKKVVHDSMSMIVDKAMEEPHFAELYARFSSNLAKVHKIFKKTLLALCESHFDDTAESGDSAADMADTDEEAIMIKKKYIGLMQFIGELYRVDIIKGKIMISCLERLFVRADEEKLECFAKLMTTVGDKLDHEEGIEDHDHLEHIWQDVNSMAGRPRTDGQQSDLKAPSNRIKFLLQDLIDMRNDGWKLSKRKQDEKAKTIAQIHKEVAMEEKNRRSPQKAKMVRSQSAGMNLSSSKSPSFNNDMNSDSLLPPLTNEPTQDADGFQQVKMPKKNSLRRVQSDVAATQSSLQRALAGKSPAVPPKATKQVTLHPPAPVAFNFPDAETCKTKTKNILKEYFVGGDTEDAVLSVEELVGLGKDTDEAAVRDRGAAITEAGILLVMESKESDVTKFMLVMKECLTKGKVGMDAVALGLKDPLEFLRDIEIDAPLASKYLAGMIAEWMATSVKAGDGQPLSFLLFLQAPDYFKSDGRPADFLKQVLASYTAAGNSITDEHVDVVSQLMTEEERSANPDIRAWLASS